jgi:hypothetical protein
MAAARHQAGKTDLVDLAEIRILDPSADVSIADVRWLNLDVAQRLALATSTRRISYNFGGQN